MSSPHTRQGALRRGVALLAGAVGLGTAGSAVAARPPASLASLHLQAAGVTSSVGGRARGRAAEHGDRQSTHGVLLGRDGRVVGSFATTGVAMRTPLEDGLSTIEQHVFVLADGTITGAGHAIAGVGTFAVTGGTGRYAGTRGTYEATISAHGRAGDGTATFTFSLTS